VFSLEAFPIVLVHLRHWEPMTSPLPYLELLVAVVLALCINVTNQTDYKKAVEKEIGRLVPKARSPPVVVGSVFFSPGLSVHIENSSPTPDFSEITM